MESKNEEIYFSVSGFDVSIYNMWRDGSVHTENLQGLLSFDQTISRNNETHSLKWTNITCDYGNSCVASFHVNIDGKNYQYPDGSNGNGAEYGVNFTIDDTLYSYKESYGSRSHPYMHYISEQDPIPEQYIILASQTASDFQNGINTFVIGFIHSSNTWHLNLLFINKNSEYTYFWGPNIDIDILTNRTVVGGLVTFSISGPINSSDNSSVISNISVSAEYIGE